MEVYEGHLGIIYFSPYEIDPEYLYCEQCGDSDWHLGHADTWEEVLELITDVDEDGSEWCKWAPDYVEELKVEYEELLENGVLDGDKLTEIGEGIIFDPEFADLLEGK